MIAPVVDEVALDRPVRRDDLPFLPFFENLAESLTNDGVIVGEKNANSGHGVSR